MACRVRRRPPHRTQQQDVWKASVVLRVIRRKETPSSSTKRKHRGLAGWACPGTRRGSKRAFIAQSQKARGSSWKSAR